MAAPELLAKLDAADLQRTAHEIGEWQASRSMSDAALCRMYAELGSATTFRRIASGDLAGIDAARKLENYRTALALMQGEPAEGPSASPFADISATLILTRAFAETRRENGLARCIFLLGPSGSGKTEALRFLHRRHGPRVICVRATTLWNSGPHALMSAVCKQLGARRLPADPIARFEVLVKKLRARRRAVFIEDSHHLGPRALALIVSMIDETPGEFVLAAVDTLWNRLQTRAYQEVEQLRVNRLAEVIRLGHEVLPGDVAKLVERRMRWAKGGEENSFRDAVALLTEKASRYGRLAFVREVIARANEAAGSDSVTADLLKTAITAEINSR